MVRSNQVLTLPPPAATTTELPPSPTKSTRYGTMKEKEKDKDKKKDKFKTEGARTPKSSHAPNPFMFNRGNASNKGTPKKGLRRTQSSGSLNDSPRGIPYSQMPANNSAYNLNLGPSEAPAMQFMFPSLEDSDPRSDSPPLLPPPNLAQLQDGVVSNSPYGQDGGSSGHVRGTSFDSSSPRPTIRLGGGSKDSTLQFNAQGMSKIGSRSTVYLEGTGSSRMGTSNGSGSPSGTGAMTGLSMGLGNRSRPRVGSGPKGQSIIVKDHTVRERKETEKSIGPQNKERDWTPDKFNALLSQTKVTEIETERLKKLRIMLRNESTT